MSFLGYDDLWKAIGDGRLDIRRSRLIVTQREMQPASIDLHLANEFLIMEPVPWWRRLLRRVWPVKPIDTMLNDSAMWDKEYVNTTAPFTLKRRAFVLASTMEEIWLSASVLGMVAGKSSLARVGLITESAGFVDPGFQGTITLELANLTDRGILLYPGMAIAQMCVANLETPTTRLYGKANGNHYQDQDGPTASRYGE